MLWQNVRSTVQESDEWLGERSSADWGSEGQAGRRCWYSVHKCKGSLLSRIVQLLHLIVPVPSSEPSLGVGVLDASLPEQSERVLPLLQAGPSEHSQLQSRVLGHVRTHLERGQDKDRNGISQAGTERGRPYSICLKMRNRNSQMPESGLTCSYLTT